MDAIHRFSHRLLSLSFPKSKSKSIPSSKSPVIPLLHSHKLHPPTSKFVPICPKPLQSTRFILSDPSARTFSSSTLTARAGWLLGLGEKKRSMPDLVKAGDPVLHEPAREVEPNEIGSERIQKIIDDMIGVMRKAPGVGLAAPQIGIPLKIIVLEDTKECINYAPKEEIKAQDRRPFELLVIVNPKLKKKSDRTALFFEGCLSVDGYRAVVERYLDVEVTGLDRYGQPLKLEASGWRTHSSA